MKFFLRCNAILPSHLGLYLRSSAYPPGVFTKTSLCRAHAHYAVLDLININIPMAENHDPLMRFRHPSVTSWHLVSNVLSRTFYSNTLSVFSLQSWNACAQEVSLNETSSVQWSLLYNKYETYTVKTLHYETFICLHEIRKTKKFSQQILAQTIDSCFMASNKF